MGVVTSPVVLYGFAAVCKTDFLSQDNDVLISLPVHTTFFSGIYEVWDI